jgi:hypothetical protein
MNAIGATTVKASGERSRGFRDLFRRRRLESRGVSFPELAWVHFLRQRELKEGHHQPYKGPAEHRYRDFEERFESANGTIVNQYWCSSQASGIALTIKRRPLLLADTVRLHWATDWSTRDKPKLMRLLYDCESLAVRVQEVLRDTRRRIAMQSVFNVISFVLGFAETERAHNDRAVAEVDRAVRERLEKIEKYYRGAAERSGQIVYVGGMLLGMVPALLLAILSPSFISNYEEVSIGMLCFSAGAVGALMSVMSRLSSGTVRVDWEFGKDTLRTLGALRPFVGATFGLMTYLALKSGVIGLKLNGNGDDSYYYIVFAFAAGFSERLAQDMLLGSTVEAVTRRGKHRSETEPPPEEHTSEPQTG